ncbi:MAG: EAL and HDOD domain-containing protein [Gemmatimonas sp.]
MLETPLRPIALDVYVARQPIYDVRNEVVAYELLYRDSAQSTGAGPRPADVMCNEMALHAMLTIGLDRLTSGSTAWINMTRDHLLNGLHRVFSPQNIVVELLESVDGDAEVVAACERAVADGYVIALDDYDARPELAPLLPLASVIKLQIFDRQEAELAPLVRSLTAQGLTVLAECVETVESRNMCQRIGCSLFQGYVFSRPETLAGRAMSVEQVTILNILSMLGNDRVSEAKLEQAFQSHPTLSYALLRIVNSAAIGLRSVTSIPHAMRIIGRAALSRWLHVMLMATVASRSPLAHEAVHQALTRARFCELMTESSGTGDPAAQFMVGLLSRLDVLLGIPLSAVLEQLPVRPEVRSALLEGTGTHARTLRTAIAYENANWDEVRELAPGARIKLEALMESYAEATEWATERLESARK